MALTPEDVVNKRFNPTKFREGYDQDEVDDFLDEVVVELRRLGQENEELRQRLVASESRIGELQRSGAAAPAAAAPPAPAYAAPAPAVVPEPAYVAPVAPTDPSIDPSNTNNLLQLARRLHEEHVREGVEKRDALISEGHAAAARVVQEAEQTGRAALGKIEQERSALEQERTTLERRVEELRLFEREYREKLKSYIQGQLEDLESSQSVTPAAQPAVAAAPAASAPAGLPDYAQVSAPTPAPQPAAAAPAPATPTPAAYPASQPSDYAGYPQQSPFPGLAGGN